MITDAGLEYNAFVRRREQRGQGFSFFAENHNDPITEEIPGDFLYSDGVTGYSPVYDPPKQSSFTGGRGRQVAPAFDPSEAFYINWGTSLGGEGASWEWEHFGIKQPMPAPAFDSYDPGKVGASNHPISGYPGMIAWPERSNEYRAPWEAFSSIVDQRTGYAEKSSY